MEQLDLFGGSKKISVREEKIRDIISASRRTDIPAFHWGWMKECIKQGYAETVNPYSFNISKIDLKPDNVHSIVFWSKDYSHYIKDNSFLDDYNLYFQFTITGNPKILEPRIPSKFETIKQVEYIANKFSPEHLNIRFDPIMLIGSNIDEARIDRLNAFEGLCKDLSLLGIRRVTTSFVTLYDKVKARLKKHSIQHIDLTHKQQIEFLKDMVEVADKYNIQVYTCSNPLVENTQGVKASACIDGEILEKLFGEITTVSKDPGQRDDCNCVRSREIGGSYSLKSVSSQVDEETFERLKRLDKSCNGGCLYCYANLKE